jgi:YmgG-like glycine-zipper protein
MIYRSVILVAILFVFLASTPVIAQQQIIYPAEGQSAEQQQKDEAECYTWAKEQTGYDPVQATQYAAPPPQQSVGGERLGGAARGAAGGAAIGALAGNAGKGAAIGAVGGTLLGGGKRRSKDAENQQAMENQQQAIAQQQQNYQRAYTACFEGRGYTVR